MMIIKSCGRWGIIAPVSTSVLMSLTTSVHAWQQEYIFIDPQSNTSERYTWDSDHQPRYEDILAERINSTQVTSGYTTNAQDSGPLDPAHTMSVGWNFPLASGTTTGPVASWHYDGSRSEIWNAYESGESPNDPLWHASVSKVGWRVDTDALWGVRSWAQVSYNQQYGDNQWKSQPGFYRGAPAPAGEQNGNWMDVTVGADMLVNPHLAAYASLSQADNAATGTNNYLYILGVSAAF
jgi:uncharacterized protein YhjY with autotransporter beta-barrel domain